MSPSRVLRLTVLLALGCIVAAHSGLAQIKTDGTLGAGTDLKGPDFQIGEELGTQVGKNLFHSFEQFNIRTLSDGTIESATFTGPGNLANVISRVTGGDPSEINGLLRSQIGKADLWFLNPNGIAFGPNARLDVPGSFHVSTADELRFADGAVFSAADPHASSLTVAPPEAFGFLDPPDGAEPGSIDVHGSTLALTEQQTLSLVGGDLSLDGAALGVSSGRINLVSAGAAGDVALQEGPDRREPVVERGDVILTGSVLGTNGAGSGSVEIRGGAVLLQNTAVFAQSTGEGNSGGISIAGDNVRLDLARIFSSTAAPGNAGPITIAADDSLTLTGNDGISSIGSFVNVGTEGGGDGGQLTVSAPRVVLEQGATLGAISSGEGAGGNILIAGNSVRLDSGFLLSSAAAVGNAGSISIAAGESITFTRTDSVSGLPSGANVGTGEGSIGHGGRLQIEAPQVILEQGTNLVAGSSGAGNSGSIEIRGGGVAIDHASVGSIGGEGPGGSISITGDDVRLSAGLVGSPAFGSGNAGPITVTADHLDLRGASLIASATASSGQGGDVTVSVGSLNIAEASAITSSTFGGTAADAGDVAITARESITIENNGSVNTGTSGTGDGGRLTIATPLLVLNDGGIIGAGTLGEGHAGEIDLLVGRLSLTGDSLVTTLTNGQGRAGAVNVSAEDAITFDDSDVSAITHSAGAGGHVRITAPRIEVRDDAFIAALTEGTGPAGTIEIAAGSLLVTGDADLTAGSLGLGPAGHVTVTATEGVTVSDSGSIDAFTNGDGPGGRVTITAPRLDVTDMGLVATSTLGRSSDAGPLSIDVGRLTVTDGSVVSTGTNGGGRAGELVINADESVRVSGLRSAIVASASENSFGKGGGTIRVATPRLIVSDVVQGTGGGIFPTGGILAQSRGSGPAGDILLEIGDTLVMDEAAIATEARSAGGGGIIIRGANLLDMQDSVITSRVRELTGDAGSITLSPSILVADSAVIRASTFAGEAGTVRIGGIRIQSPDSVVDVSSVAGIPGQLVTEGPDVDLAGDLAELPATFLVSERLFEQSCAARSGEPVSSLVSTGRGGLPADPERPLSGLYFANRGVESPVERTGQKQRANDELPGGMATAPPIVAFLECGG